MYRIIGADQKEYGPVTPDQVREWIQAGRANAQTRIQAEGGTDWQLLADLPEFADALGLRPVGNSPPPLPAAANASGLAISSLVLGILGVLSCGITSLVGLVLGIVALVKINRSQGRMSGNGLAIAGIAVSAFFLLLTPLFAAMLLPAMAKAKSKAQTIQCVNNVKQLALSAMIYANDHNGRFPEADRWCDALQPFLGSPKVLRCAAGSSSDRCHYAFNAQLSGAELNRVEDPARTVLFVESVPGWNQSGGPELLTQPSRHHGQIVIGFADGHVEVATKARLENLRWEP